jgi:dolichyl-diphosphooligosaccharide--protein glycosyltransferase
MNKTIKTVLLVFAVIITAYVIYYPLKDSNDIALYSGPVLNDNWFSALNWIKNNTPECSIIATYWDPGHFITGIAERPVVFDGATQNSMRTLTIEGSLSDDEIRAVAAIPNYEFRRFEKDGKNYTNITTARIQDIGMSLLTSNESQALQILKKYQYPTPRGAIPECPDFSVYYIASGDLIGKSQWWTYFGSWSPATHTGTKYYYIPIGLGQRKPMLSDNATAYVYPISTSEQFVIYEKNSTLNAFYQQGSNVLRVEKLFYFSGQYGIMMSNPDSELKGMVWLSPDMGTIIFVPTELENSMFTKMFLFNGQGLEKYKMVGNFGGEIKIFEVNMSA